MADVSKNEKEVDRFIDRLTEIMMMQVEAEAAASSDQSATEHIKS